MRFRAIIRDVNIMQEFTNTILTLSKLTKECIMIISKTKMHIILNEESNTAAPLVWIEFIASTYFNEYIMDGIDQEEYTDILLSFNPSIMSRALSNIRNEVKFVKIKLANKQFPCLTFDIETFSTTGTQNRNIIHDVPVHVIPVNEWDLYELPKLPPLQIVLTMPNSKLLRNLIYDLRKNISPNITIYATKRGELIIVSEIDEVTVTLNYSNLELKKLDRKQFQKRRNHDKNTGGNDDENDNMENNDDDDDDDDDTEYEVSCLVDCKKTAIFLSALQFHTIDLDFGLVQDNFLQIELPFTSGMKIICVIAAVCD